MTQTPIFEAMIRRDHGMAQAENAADPRIILAIDAAIDRAIDSGQPFTVNDIRDQFPTVESQGLVGDRVRAASMRKPTRMVQTGRFPKSTLPSTRCARVAEWVGAEYAQAVSA